MFWLALADLPFWPLNAPPNLPVGCAQEPDSSAFRPPNSVTVSLVTGTSAPWVTVLLKATPLSCASLIAVPVSLGWKGSVEHPVGLKSGDAVVVSVLLA